MSDVGLFAILFESVKWSIKRLQFSQLPPSRSICYLAVQEKSAGVLTTLLRARRARKGCLCATADVEAARLLLRMCVVADGAAKALVTTLAALLRCCRQCRIGITWDNACIPELDRVRIYRVAGHDHIRARATLKRPSDNQGKRRSTNRF